MNAGRDPSDRRTIKFSVTLAHSLGMCVTAEGVEDAAALSVLRECAVDYAQGYYLGRPMNAAAVELVAH